MGQRESVDIESRRGRRGRGRRSRRRHVGDDHDGDDRGHDDRPEDDQWNGQALQAVGGEAPDTALFDHQVSEEARHDEEGRHAEHMDDVEQ